MHGYEMIQEIAERSGGAWKPSPGSVYPTLQLLEDEGLITSESEGGKKLFSLTESGRAAADEGPDAPWEEASRGVDWEALHEIRQAGFGLMEAFGQVWKTGDKDQRDKALAVINEARKKLYLILADES
jgi:DNA-binding PadR family transcriptional regulator